jgi:integral membrane sensor domain MASE1
MKSLVSKIARIGILAVIYFIAGKIGLMLASVNASASPVWPPAGIALAALLLLGSRVWPAIFIGAFLVNLTTAGNVATSFAISTGNTLEALVGVWLVNRFAGGTNVFERPQGVFKFALAAAVSAIISPAFGVTSLGVASFADWANYGAIWLTWWLGDVTSHLVFTPLVLLWSVASKRRWTKKEFAEVGVLFLLLVLLSGAVFGGWPAVSTRNYPVALICGPIVIWTAFRFRQRETATGIFILSAIAVWGTLHGFGPFVSGTENQSLLALQGWTAVLSITAMALSAGMAERRRIGEELQRQKIALESANRTKDHLLAMLTQLTPVISAFESLEAKPQAPEKLKPRRRKQESDIVRPRRLPQWARSMAVIALVVGALAMVISSLSFLRQVSLRMTLWTPQSFLDWPVWAIVWMGFWLGMTVFYAVLACRQWWTKRKGAF